MTPMDVKAILRSATGELEDRVWRKIIGATSSTTSAAPDRQMHEAIMSDIRLILSEAATDIASRLPRQDDEIRKAELEEAAKKRADDLHRRAQAAEGALMRLQYWLSQWGEYLPSFEKSGITRRMAEWYMTELGRENSRGRALSQKGDEADG